MKNSTSLRILSMSVLMALMVFSLSTQQARAQIPAPGDVQFNGTYTNGGYMEWTYDYGSLVNSVGVANGGYFEVWRSTDGGNNYSYFTDTAQYLDCNPDNTYQYFGYGLTDDTVPVGETYYYKVKLVCDLGDSDLSSSYVTVTGE